MKGPGKIKLTKEDKETFAREAKTLNPMEFLVLSRFIDDHKARFTKADLKFINSHLGRRAERLLRNVVENFSFDDRPESKAGKEEKRSGQQDNGDPVFT